MALAPVRSGALRLLLFIHCVFVVVHIVCGGLVLGPCFVLQYFCRFKFCNQFAGEERAGCIILLCSECHVAVIVLSFLANCGFSWSYSLLEGTLKYYFIK